MFFNIQGSDWSCLLLSHHCARSLAFGPDCQEVDSPLPDSLDCGPGSRRMWCVQRDIFCKLTRQVRDQNLWHFCCRYLIDYAQVLYALDPEFVVLC